MSRDAASSMAPPSTRPPPAGFSGSDRSEGAYVVQQCPDGFPELLIRADGCTLSLEDDLDWLRFTRAHFETLEPYEELSVTARLGVEAKRHD
jgi:hypothetical protein